MGRSNTGGLPDFEKLKDSGLGGRALHPDYKKLLAKNEELERINQSLREVNREVNEENERLKKKNEDLEELLAYKERTIIQMGRQIDFP